VGWFSKKDFDKRKVGDDRLDASALMDDSYDPAPKEPKTYTVGDLREAFAEFNKLRDANKISNEIKLPQGNLVEKILKDQSIGDNVSGTITLKDGTQFDVQKVTEQITQIVEPIDAGKKFAKRYGENTTISVVYDDPSQEGAGQETGGLPAATKAQQPATRGRPVNTKAGGFDPASLAAALAAQAEAAAADGPSQEVPRKEAEVEKGPSLADDVSPPSTPGKAPPSKSLEL
ncbi:MAG: hypothetical protein AAF195_05015, partial [Pseudomonadota bacterium]